MTTDTGESILPGEKHSPLHEQEKTEERAIRDIAIITLKNQDRYNTARIDTDAFFNTIWPVALKHAQHILGKAREETEYNMMAAALLSTYVGVWNMWITRKP